MPYLAAAVAAVAVLGLLNLLLTLAALRRLRQYAEQLSSSRSSFEGGVIAAGERPAEVTAVDIAGRPVPGAGSRLIGFFSPDCQACKEGLPTFVTAAAGHPEGPGGVLAVVAGEEPGVTDFTRRLSGVAQVVVESTDGPVSAAFQVTAFPAWCVLDEHGVVERSGVGLDGLPVPAAR